MKKSFWLIIVFSWFCILVFPQNNSVNIKVDVKIKGTSLNHIWSYCVGAGRANEGLRISWIEHLALAREQCGFQYVRFHGLFHDDMFVYKEINGNPYYNFQYIDDVFDRMLAMNVRPFVELGLFPEAISAKETCFWWGGHGAPPDDFTKWIKLVEAFIHHCINRYGIEEVQKWYFEVWNEPNLSGFWGGTMQQYFDMYKLTVLAIKSINPTLRTGGPATSSYHPEEGVYDSLKALYPFSPEVFRNIQCKGPWIEEFIEFCRSRKPASRFYFFSSISYYLPS
ncbi:MAG: hypothetical protein HC906_04440 [Bacteroidales bacterium]|nr:hypothetical protein [Bacteroidales bacterium]